MLSAKLYLSKASNLSCKPRYALTQLYRDAKAAAAREGITLTRFIESALQIRLNSASLRVAALPIFDSGAARDLDVLALMHSAEAELG
jgi:hypothetical protein